MPAFTQSSWMTDFGRRPDLEAIEANEPLGYIGSRIYPRTPSRFKSGMLSGLTLPQYAAAQTNRVDGAAPSTTLITNSEVSYTTAEIIARFGKTAKQVMDTGNIYKCDEQGARGAIYSYMYTLEQARLTALVTPVSGNYNIVTPNAGTKITDAIFAALKAVRRYHGRRVLIVGADMAQKIANSLEFRTFYSGMPFARRDSLLDGLERIVSAMQTVFLLDEVLVADDTILNAAGNASAIGDYIVAAVIPDENTVTEDSYTYQTELGRTVVYQPYEGIKDFQLESFPDGDKMTNWYTAYGMTVVKEINPMAKCIINPANLDFSSGSTVTITGGTVVTIDGGTVSA